MKKISIFIILFALIFTPFAGYRIAYVNAGIVPDCGTVTTTTDISGKITKEKTIKNPCDFDDLMILINNVINFLLFVIATPLIACILCYAGFLMLTSGGSAEKVTKVKGILKNVVLGYILALIAWLLIKTILTTVGFDPKEAFLIEF